jgi:hypothetical protein
MRKSILLALVLMVALVAVPAFASVQNVKVSGDVDSTYIYRDNFDLGANTVGDENQSLFITQTRLRVDADLTDQVSATVALINERPWNVDTASSSDIDLNLAYVTLREMLYSPLTVVAGRQNFSYGNSFIVDSAGTNNVAPADSGIATVAGDLTKQTALDAIRMIFDYNPLTLEVLYSKLNAGVTTLIPNGSNDDSNLYGVNATYELGDSMNTQIETYFFARINKSPQYSFDGNGNPQESASKADTLYVPGLRASADVLDGLNIQGELAWQRGNRVAATTSVGNNGLAVQNEKREAMAAQVIANYQVPKDVLPDAISEYSPALQYVYTYVSGDSNPNDRGSNNVAGVQNSTNKYTGWDPLLENQGAGKIYNAIFNLTNANIHSVALSAKPIEDVTTKLTWTGLWLDKKIDSNNGTQALVQPDGTNTANLQLDTGNKDVGYEIDFDTMYDYTEDVQFGASLGWFVPGDLFRGDIPSPNNVNGNDKMASQVLIHGIVNF